MRSFYVPKTGLFLSSQIIISLSNFKFKNRLQPKQDIARSERISHSSPEIYGGLYSPRILQICSLFHFRPSALCFSSIRLDRSPIAWIKNFTFMKPWDSESVPPVMKTTFFCKCPEDYLKGKKSMDIIRSLFPCQYISGISIRILT